MIQPPKRNWGIIQGGITIAVLYSLYYIFLIDSTFYWALPRGVRHANKIFLVVIVYVIGTYALKNYVYNWLMFIWHIIHVVVIGLLIIIGVYDLFFKTVSTELKNLSQTFLEILISPLFFVAVAILNNRLIKREL